MRRLQLLVAALTLVVTMNSCSKDDTPLEASPAVTIEGTWIYSKEDAVVDGQEVLTDYEHTTGCSKDNLEIKTNGTGGDNYYSSNQTPCQLVTNSFTWVKKDSNNLTFTKGSDVYNVQILTLTAKELKVKYTNGDIELFTK